MKIREIIENLLKNNNLEDEVIIAYWDKDYFIQWAEIEKNKVNKVWEEFAIQGQNKVDSYNEFTQTGFELIADLEKMIEENE